MKPTAPVARVYLSRTQSYRNKVIADDGHCRTGDLTAWRTNVTGHYRRERLQILRLPVRGVDVAEVKLVSSPGGAEVYQTIARTIKKQPRLPLTWRVHHEEHRQSHHLRALKVIDAFAALCFIASLIANNASCAYLAGSGSSNARYAVREA